MFKSTFETRSARNEKSRPKSRLFNVYGTRGAIVDEPLSWPVTEPAKWREPKFDLGELARLRFIQGYDQRMLAKHFGKSVFAIRNYYVKLRQADLSSLGFSKRELALIRKRI